MTLLHAPMRAEAAKVPFVITTGDSISNIGQVPAEAKPAIEKLTEPGVEVGFVYSYFGLFWLDAWTWDGRYCLYHGKTIWKLSPTQTAKILGIEENKLPTPLFYRFPSLLVLLLVAVIAMFIIGKFTKSDEEIAAELLKDDRYKEALTLFREEYSKVQSKQSKSTDAATGKDEKKESEKESDKESEEVDADEVKERQMKAALEPGVAFLISKGVPKEEAEQKLEVLAKVEVIEKTDVAAAATP
ncbi:MAG: hypothetical protein JNM40_17220 [Myxococcales bacterium]|nr:hypothetical protein [Myxococcales bacterium]